MNSPNFIEDVPRYVRYDFFMALFGIITAYFSFTNNIIFTNSTLKILFAVMSTSCLLYGLLEMKNNYEKDKKIQELERECRKRELLQHLQKLETEAKK